MPPFASHSHTGDAPSSAGSAASRARASATHAGAVSLPPPSGAGDAAMDAYSLATRALASPHVASPPALAASVAASSDCLFTRMLALTVPRYSWCGVVRVGERGRVWESATVWMV